MPPKTIMMHIRLSARQHARLIRHSEATDISQASIVRFALAEYFNKRGYSRDGDAEVEKASK